MYGFVNLMHDLDTPDGHTATGSAETVMDADTTMDAQATVDTDNTAVCAVLEYKLQKKTRKVRKLKREMEKEARWKKIDRIFWFMLGYGACLLLCSICETAAKMATGMVP